MSPKALGTRSHQRKNDSFSVLSFSSAACVIDMSIYGKREKTTDNRYHTVCACRMMMLEENA